MLDSLSSVDIKWTKLYDIPNQDPIIIDSSIDQSNLWNRLQQEIANNESLRNQMKKLEMENDFLKGSA